MHLYNAVPDASGIEGKVTIQQHLLWDRKVEGGFPGMCSALCIDVLRTGASVAGRLNKVVKLSSSESHCIHHRHLFYSSIPHSYPILHFIQAFPHHNPNLTSSSETKQLKRLVRDIIDPSRDLGHVDGKKSTNSDQSTSAPSQDATTISTSSQQPPPLPKALNRLQSSSGSERKFTPMDVDTASAASAGLKTGALETGEEEMGGLEEEEKINEKALIEIGSGEGEGFCRPGDEDCG